jgi:hypothetical protein
LERSFSKHIDNGELSALLPSTLETNAVEMRGLSPEAVGEAEHQVESSWGLSKKMAKYLMRDIEGLSTEQTAEVLELTPVEIKRDCGGLG